MKLSIFFLSLFITSLTFAQQTQKVDFKTCDAAISFDVLQKKVMGTVTYTFEVLDKKTDTIYIDARNMQFTDVTINGKKAGWVNSATALKLYKGYKKGNNTVTFSYSAQPKQALYFVELDADASAANDMTDSDEEKELQIWTQGQGKYTSHWLPSFDDMNEKVIFNLEVTFDKGYTILANGKNSKNTFTTDTNQRIASYQMDKPMSSYLVMLAIGKFDNTYALPDKEKPLQLFYRPEDADKHEPTYRYSKQIFNYFEAAIGVKYPWGVYRQVPVLDFLYAGMENTTSTIFSQDFVVDSIGFNDRTYINVNAHELAHQWFGNLITAQSGEHHWLQEGFATYYALLAEQELFGDDHFTYELYQMAERLQRVAQTDTVPILSDKASSLTYYQKGAWALHVLREGVGHEAFRTAVKNYLEKYAFKNVTTDDFLAEINRVSDYDTKAFRERWLEKGGFEVQEAIALLNGNQFMELYFKLGELHDKRFEEKQPIFEQILHSDMYYPVKEEVLLQIADVPFEDKAVLIRLAMASGDIKLRQAVARTVTNFPDTFYEEYKSLLQDKSYITREIALNVLYNKFPERRPELLDLSDGWVGFNDKNLRILWLTLAYATPDYREAEKVEIYAELQGYASPRYESTVRQNALTNLLYINKPDPVVWANLVNATLHHKWQFAKFGRESIRALLKREGYHEFFESILSGLPQAEQKKLQQLLAE
ncbi:M1 family metallopeptidase [Flavobacterium salilacus subsp. salilacus]|uniref:M1 family metallopeptidase n=1 Tax=Flavobacterium TaxID=237 RepID=UPI001074DDD1|nr:MULTISPECIES: M1 family metallopeptidase [Flavobacterium]KAF2519260.1 M1 family metallopeptidase [Flavobacterium salilacus subsp. salilacus]MBE1613444.1 M1 family metallopeptidase [Flavobacterium sp. SaA2.13]